MKPITKYRSFYQSLKNYLEENASNYFGGYFPKQLANENVHAHVRMAVREYFNQLNSGSTPEQADEFAHEVLYKNFSPLPEDYYFNEFLDDNYSWFYSFYQELNENEQNIIKAELFPTIGPILRIGFDLNLSENHHLIDSDLRTVTDAYLTKKIKENFAVYKNVTLSSTYGYKNLIVD